MGRKPIAARSDLPKKSKSNRTTPEYKAYQKYLRSEEFKKVKTAVHERDGERCICCHRTAGGKITLQVHHTEYTHLGCADDREIDDCILICNICHKAISSAKGNLGYWRDKSPILNNLKNKI